MVFTVPLRNDKNEHLNEEVIEVKESGVEETEPSDSNDLNDEAIIQNNDTVDTEQQEHVHSFSQVTCTENSVCSCGEINEIALGHNWIEATCVDPKKCSVCGKSEGSAIGHNWIDATCIEAKKCSVCEEIEGTANGHNYSDGFCYVCGAEDPDFVKEVLVWIPNSGKKYHSRSTCSNMENPQQVTISSAEAQGYDPCKKCYNY